MMAAFRTCRARLLRLAQHAKIEPSDVIVDVGAGPGRAAAVLPLMTGASVIALEIQPSARRGLT